MDYVLDAVTFSGPEWRALQQHIMGVPDVPNASEGERLEFIEKLRLEEKA